MQPFNVLHILTRGEIYKSCNHKVEPLQVDELFDENSNLEEENTGLVGRAERADIQNAQLKEQLEEALTKVCSAISCRSSVPVIISVSTASQMQLWHCTIMAQESMIALAWCSVIPCIAHRHLLSLNQPMAWYTIIRRVQFM